MNTELSKNRVTEAKGTGHSSRKLNALVEMAGVQDCPLPHFWQFEDVCSIHKSGICESQTYELDHSELMREEKMRTVEGFPKGKKGINSGPNWTARWKMTRVPSSRL